jgi:hypothetical protein
MARLAAVAIVVAACGGASGSGGDAHATDTTSPDTGPDPTDGAHSGTRLKLRYWVFADGTKQWNTFYDAERKETCSSQSGWPDGNTYCTPSAAGVVYSDTACSQKVAEVYNGAPGCAPSLPGYALEYAYQPCTSGPAHLYTLAGKLALTSYYYKGSDGGCTGPYAASNESLYSLGSEVRTTDLVKLSMGGPTTGNRISQRFLTSSDGMAMPGTLHDAMLGDDCYPSYWIDGAQSAACAPSDVAYAGYAHDAVCSLLELNVYKGCTPPRFAVNYPYTACPTEPAAYSVVSGQAPASPLYYPSGNSCYAATPDPNEDYYSLGAPLSLASMTRGPEPTPGHRVQLIYMATPEGLRWRDYALYDNQQQAECGPVTLPDGSTRCIPYGGYAQTYYTSSACTATIDLVEVQTGPSSCGAPAVPRFASKYLPQMGGTCSYNYEIHSVGAEVTGPVYTSDGGCVVYQPSQTKLYQLGPVVDLSTFASASVLTDQ